jgi:hypothetical protein
MLDRLDYNNLQSSPTGQGSTSGGHQVEEPVSQPERTGWTHKSQGQRHVCMTGLGNGL